MILGGAAMKKFIKNRFFSPVCAFGVAFVCLVLVNILLRQFSMLIMTRRRI